MSGWRGGIIFLGGSRGGLCDWKCKLNILSSLWIHHGRLAVDVCVCGGESVMTHVGLVIVVCVAGYYYVCEDQ